MRNCCVIRTNALRDTFMRIPMTAWITLAVAQIDVQTADRWQVRNLVELRTARVKGGSKRNRIEVRRTVESVVTEEDKFGPRNLPISPRLLTTRERPISPEAALRRYQTICAQYRERGTLGAMVAMMCGARP